MDNLTLFSYFYNHYIKISTQKIDVAKCLNLIKSGRYKDKINKIRLLSNSDKKEDKNEVDYLKLLLPAVTFSGIFEDGKKRDNLKQSSNLVCLDFDSLGAKGAVKAKKELIEDRYTLACFISPRGQGLKAVFNADFSNDDEYRKAFRQISKYIKERYDLTSDKQTININHLCALSYDKEAYLNLNAEKFEVKAEDEPKKESYSRSGCLSLNFSGNKQSYFNTILKKQLEKIKAVGKSERNNRLYKASFNISSNFNYGLYDEATLKDYIKQVFLETHKDFSEKEAITAIDSGWSDGEKVRK